MAIALSLTGCWTPMTWRQADHPGPLISNNQHAKVMNGEGTDVGGMPRGTTAYVDAHGGYHDEMDIRKDIETYMAQIPQLKDYLPDKEGDRRSDIMEYTFYLLTIDPTVVLAVPKYDYSYCFGDMVTIGFIPSYIDGVCYPYLASPVIYPGTFWFSPDLKAGAQFLPDGQTQQIIPLGKTRLVLTAKGKVWDVQRLPAE